MNLLQELTFNFYFQAPRLQLSVIVEPNSTFTQPKFPQWSAFGEQNNGNWSFVNTMINLPDTRFRIEFNVIDIPDSRARAYIDDVSFHGCGKSSHDYYSVINKRSKLRTFASWSLKQSLFFQLSKLRPPLKVIFWVTLLV